MIDRVEEIKNYRRLVSQANKEFTKKEAFKDLLNRLFAHNPESKKIVDIITSGAEKPIFNIPRKTGIHRGSADTAYSKVIIEFENDLRTTLKHAKEQLAGYLLGQFREGEGYNYTLIASDLINWKVFSIDITSLENLGSLREDEVVLNEITTSSFELKEGKEDDFYFWIDRFLFKEEKQKATLVQIEEAFGSQSLVFRQAYLELNDYFEKVKDTGELQVSYDQWKKTLSIAYDSFNDSSNNFLIHTYLSVFSKMLAYEVISNDPYIEDEEIKGIIDGSVFHKLHINNFVENDFFSWISTDDARRELRGVFRSIAQELSMFNFVDVDEDILKGVYQELIDLDTRRRLGEYYTPDWLCERIVAELDFKETDKILDPACGSGSFLRAVIDKLKSKFPEAKIEDINDQIHGIDIHPLSVQIAKTTILLAFGKKLRETRKPLHLSIILANTLLTPRGVETLFSNQFNMEIDSEKLSLDTAIFNDGKLFDQALDVSEELAEQTAFTSEINSEVFTNILKTQYQGGEIKTEVAEDFYRIYKGLKNAKELGRDSIWKFIVQNLYKPYFLADKFDYVVGNPPWFTFGSIRNESYQNTLDALAKEYNVKPTRAKNYPNLEIAAIFLAYCSSYFLKEGGQIAFVLPRSFFSADHHDNTRRGDAEGFILNQIWDLDKVSPLFRVPSCVLIAEKSRHHPTDAEKEAAKREVFNKYSTRGVIGKEFSGYLTLHNCNWGYASKLLKESEATFFYLKQGSSSAFSSRQTSTQKVNEYKKLFRKGADLIPRAFYFVDLDQDPPPDFDDRIINIKTSDDVPRKQPWDNFTFSERIESRFLFHTALSKSVLPFKLYKPNLVVLPITIEKDKFGRKSIRLHSAESLRDEGFLHASRWFSNVERIWDEGKTERNKDVSAREWLNWKSKLTGQTLDLPYVVLYNSSAKDANAFVLKREEAAFEFIIDHKTYLFATFDLGEAYYLAAILNSSVPNELMKDFQTRGLFGARDIHKKILDIYFPRFDSSSDIHERLALISARAHTMAAEYLIQNPPQQDLTPLRLGKLRMDIKKHLINEMTEIDVLVNQLLA